jgi:hypothetical protein
MTERHPFLEKLPVLEQGDEANNLATFITLNFGLQVLSLLSRPI